MKSGKIRAEQAPQEEWQEIAAEASGLGKRTIQRSLRLYRLIIEPFPDLIEELARHPIVDETASQLEKIAVAHDER